MERDPNGIAAGQPGSKLDAGKSPLFQGLLDYFPRAALAVASLSEYGANKYSWKGWEKVPDGFNRYSNALGRHLAKEGIEGPIDLDALNDPNFPAEILHATQVAWNAFARLELYLRSIQPVDESRKVPVADGWEPLLRMQRDVPDIPLGSQVPVGKWERGEQMDPTPLAKDPGRALYSSTGGPHAMDWEWRNDPPVGSR
jgi:hypothetical protein